MRVFTRSPRAMPSAARPGLVLLASLVLAGCSTPGPVADVRYAMDREAAETEQVTQRNYELNVVQSAYVGDSMIRVRDYQRTVFASDKVSIEKPVRIAGDGLLRVYRPGRVFDHGGIVQLDGQEMAFFIDGPIGVIYDHEGRIQPRVLTGVPGYGARLSPLLETDSEAGTVERGIEEEISEAAAGRNFEIIYSGLDNSTIRLSYREFTSTNLARDAFFQSLSYPADSATIRFRDLVIGVHEVTPESITFEVVEQGD